MSRLLLWSLCLLDDGVELLVGPVRPPEGLLLVVGGVVLLHQPGLLKVRQDRVALGAPRRELALVLRRVRVARFL